MMSFKRVVLIAAVVALLTPAVALADGITFVFFDGHVTVVQPATGGALGTAATNAFSPATLKYVSRFSGNTIPGGPAGTVTANNGNLPPQIAPTFGSTAATLANTFNFGSVSWTTGLATSVFVGPTSSSTTYDPTGSSLTISGNSILPGTGATLFSGSFIGPTTLTSISAPANPSCTTCSFWYSLSGPVSGTLDPGLMTLMGFPGTTSASGLFFSFVIGFDGPNDTFGNVEGGNISLVVPEPGTLTLFGTGLIGIAGFIRRRFKA